MAEDKKKEEDKGLKDLAKDAAVNWGARTVLDKIKKKTIPKYETPSPYLPFPKKETRVKDSHIDNVFKEKKKLKKLDPSVFKKPELPYAPYYDNPKNKDVLNLSDNRLNALSKNARANIYYRLKDLKDNPSDRYAIKKEIELVKDSEKELLNRGYEKIPRKSQHIQGPSTRKFYFQKGHKTLRAIPYVGSLLGLLSSPSVDAAFDPFMSEIIHTDPIEDPNHPLHKEATEQLRKEYEKRILQKRLMGDN